MLPESIKNFINIFSKLPSIGPRQATRLAFYFITGGKNRIEETANAIDDLKNIKICSNCFFIHSNKDSLCNICADKNRKKEIIMIVEKETDLISIERTKKFQGRYLVLGEFVKNGILDAAQKLRLSQLKTFINKELNLKQDKAKEIIIATNPTTYGDLNASVIKKELEEFSDKFSRLGRGIPTGGEIEFADEDTLEQAIERRN
ncbi:MAG: toprim domain-containing protein [Patescibacteria group bacterium]|nr:toprim domain-containing protein [Patescibacteria group bacterium]